MTLVDQTSELDFGPPQSLILYLDADLIIINKPPGLLSIRDGYNENLPHLATYLEKTVGKLWIIHRLDKDTSGVMILGRNAGVHRYFNEEFRTRNVQKCYHCLVAGCPDWTELMVTFPLSTNVDRLHRTRVNHERGKPAKTGLKVLRHFETYTLLECELFTGYTHQIRAHLFALGLTVLKDTLYCLPENRPNDKNSFGLGHIALHSRYISFQHPITGQNLSFTAPYPEDFKKLISA